MSGNPELSLVIPVYNEEECIGRQIEAVHPVLQGLGRSFEIVVVDDGSTDGTMNAIAAARAAHPEVRVVRLARNSGQSAATCAGLSAARGGLVLIMDGDLQSDPADIPRLLERLATGDCDAVCGWREKRADGLGRLLSSRAANFMRNLISGERVKDTGCPLKLFRAEFLRRVPAFRGMHRFLPTLAAMEGARIAELPVRHRPRPAGRSKYGFWNRFFASSVDLLAVRWLKSRHLRFEAREVE